MDKMTVKEIIMKVLNRDYERWVTYADECIKDRSAYTKSFYVWKDDNKLIEKDAELLTELFCS